MRIKSIIKTHNQLFKLKVVITKINKKNIKYITLNIEDIECRLKKGLHIIYKFQIKNKKILFIYNKNSKTIKAEIKNLLKLTKHKFISEHTWLNGIITNKKSFLIYSSQKILQHITLKFKTDNELVVMLNNQINQNITNENYKNKIPIISLKSNLNVYDNQFSYKISGNFFLNKKKIKNNFFLALLRIVLKKLKKKTRIKF